MRRLKDIESLYLPPTASRKAAAEYFPYVYIEAGIDFNDVRTGYKCAVKLARALKMHDDHAFPGWIEEIIHDADIDNVQEVQPRAVRLHPPPEFMDAEFIDVVKNRYIEYLARTWKRILYHNSELKIYSGAGESREEFTVRCRELFLERMREELNQVRVIFKRIKDQLKEKYLGIGDVELPDSVLLAPEENDRNIFSRYAERIDALFMNAASLTVDAAIDTPSRMDTKSELEDRLISLMEAARGRIARLRETYGKKSELIDEYILRPNLKNIHCERSCILWMPRKAE